jgi:S1-C subfamily serine protease
LELDDFKKRRPSFFGYFLSALLGAVVGSWLLLTFGPAALFTKFQQPAEPIQSTQPQAVEKVVETVKSDVSYSASKVMPSVVGIRTTTVEKGIFKNKQVQGVGTGVIIDSSGYILTNNHVAGANAKNITVSLSDGRDIQGTTVWSDPTLDMSIVKISEDNLTAAILGDSDSVKVGETAIAIGNPLGLKFQRTVTAGIISALNRTIEVEEGVYMEDLIQTDASINPGNSGGPLVNINGEVVGINTVKVTSAEGIGFAIPINIVTPVLESLKQKGSFVTPMIGIKGFDKQIAEYYNYSVDTGIYIYEVIKNSPAAMQGIKEGDTIVSVNGITVNTLMDMREALYKAGVGNTVKLQIKTALGTFNEVDVELVGAK